MKYDPNVALRFLSQYLPDCVTEFSFAKSVLSEDGKPRQWRFDFAWLEYNIALEVEGGIWIGGGHNRGKGYSKDMEKYNTAVLLGWRVIRVTPKDLCMEKTVAMIQTLISNTK